jgi:hypothetical protein
VTGNEVEVAAQRFIQQAQALPLGVLRWQGVHRGGEVLREIEGHAVADFGFEEEDVFERGDEVGPGFGTGLVVGQFAEGVRGGIAALAVAVRVGEGLEAGGDGLVGGALLFRGVEMRVPWRLRGTGRGRSRAVRRGA